MTFGVGGVVGAASLVVAVGGVGEGGIAGSAHSSLTSVVFFPNGGVGEGGIAGSAHSSFSGVGRLGVGRHAGGCAGLAGFW